MVDFKVTFDNDVSIEFDINQLFHSFINEEWKEIWVAVDDDGSIFVFSSEPEYCEESGEWELGMTSDVYLVRLGGENGEQPKAHEMVMEITEQVKEMMEK